MPTEWSDVSFYGPGTLFRDGERIAEGRPTHMMLTEFVRGEDYELATDAQVNPGGRHLHLMMAPFDVFGNEDPVPTGFELPNGSEQPFLHIMYPGVSAEADIPAFEGELPEALEQEPPAISPPEPPAEAPYRASPWWPYLQAHLDDDSPRDILGGPYVHQAIQEQGTVNWVLPGKRKLDPTVFGTADAPRGTEGPPMLIGVPPPLREAADGGGRRTSQPVPFSDEFAPVEGSLEVTTIDATATDAATTKDRIALQASFTGPGGADYDVVVRHAAPHGWFLPTAGGVITSFIQHGVTGWGTRLMPTEYSEMSFYGPGTIIRNGEVIAEGRIVHGMLTEFVRGEGYALATDAQVNPGGRHFHLMVAPFDRFGRQDPLPTGFELPNGSEQPFLHIMYPGVSSTGGALATSDDGPGTAAPAPATAGGCPEGVQLPEGTDVHGSRAASGGQVTLEADDLFFAPTCVTGLSPGTVEVTVENVGESLHNIQIDDQGLDRDVAAGETVTVEVEVPESGAVTFVCKYHATAGMNGALVTG